MLHILDKEKFSCFLRFFSRNLPKDTSKVAQDSDCNTDSETEVDARVPSVLGKIPREETKEAAELLFV